MPNQSKTQNRQSKICPTAPSGPMRSARNAPRNHPRTPTADPQNHQKHRVSHEDRIDGVFGVDRIDRAAPRPPSSCTPDQGPTRFQTAKPLGESRFRSQSLRHVRTSVRTSPNFPRGSTFKTPLFFRTSPNFPEVPDRTIPNLRHFQTATREASRVEYDNPVRYSYSNFYFDGRSAARMVKSEW
jgi:hypothetical protein